MINDTLFTLAVGKHRNATNWQNIEILWSQFADRLKTTHRTAETLAEYAAADKSRQDEIKDIGGYVGGYIPGGRRKKDNILYRQLVTLDIDFGNMALWDNFTMLYGNAAALYSTHKHTAFSPRFRLLLPLDRAVQPDEYQAISRKIAGALDIELFDVTTFEVNRLMFWPSTSIDGDYYYQQQTGPLLSADEVLSSYHNWRDSSQWPVSVRVRKAVETGIAKQGDPLLKPGVIGAFCRVHGVAEAIDTFLPQSYEKCEAFGDDSPRYTYKFGSTAGGLIVYENKFAYSFHGTDPASGKLCNAFDLVRLHLFGAKDDGVKPDMLPNKLPSYLEMIHFAAADPETRQLIAVEKLESAFKDLAGVPLAEAGQDQAPQLIPLTKENSAWLAGLKCDSKGVAHSSIDNVVRILKNDPNLRGCFAWNDFEKREIATRSLPWRHVDDKNNFLTNADDSNLRHYFENFYTIKGKDLITDGLKIVLAENSFHPVREYLNAQFWDGTERVERLFVEYMGAEDSDYLRAVTRKVLCAAIARVFNPGVKFDYVAVFVGPQGIQKSALFDRLARQWFSDSLHSIGEGAAEQLQGVWIIELAELSSTRKAEVDAVKHFVAKRVDRFRVKYEKRPDNFPRQCIFVGSTNLREFLKDVTGDRRFWPIETVVVKPTKKPLVDLTDTEISQIWAEAMTMYKAGEPLYLNAELEAEAFTRQTEHREKDDRAPLIEDYLNTKVPANWYDLTIYQRWDYLSGDKSTGVFVRDKICVQEIWCECLQGKHREMTNNNTKSLHNLMKTMPGWQEHNNNKLRFGFYGVAKAYIRAISVAANV